MKNPSVNPSNFVFLPLWKTARWPCITRPISTCFSIDIIKSFLSLYSWYHLFRICDRWCTYIEYNPPTYGWWNWASNLHAQVLTGRKNRNQDSNHWLSDSSIRILCPKPCYVLYCIPCYHACLLLNLSESWPKVKVRIPCGRILLKIGS